MRKYLIPFLILLLSAACFGQQRFPEPELAAQALKSAVESQQPEAVHELLGASDLMAGDGENVARKLSALFSELWALAPTEDPDLMILRLGREGWPFPVPLTKSEAGWAFDADLGRQELRNRQVGRNELVAIETLQRLYDAQHDYYGRRVDAGEEPSYSFRIRSQEGQRDGLYWPAATGEQVSPLEAALATAWEYAQSHREDDPWFGYRFRFLEGQADNAPGGARDFRTDNGAYSGWALVAYPERYGQSGVMSFLISHDGVLYERDLGEKTGEIAGGLTTFDPGGDWVVLTP